VRAFALAVSALALGCTSTPPPDDAEADVADAPEEEFTLCARPCPAGQVCRGFVCVAVPDASRADATGDATRIDGNVTTDAPPTAACCPIDPTPHCGCVRAGGARRADGTCRVVCDEGYPELWFRRTDLDGCSYWSTPGLRCPGADAGADAE